jgi:AraC-like DNA-binding protein
MDQSVQIDLVELVRNLVSALSPIAQVDHIKLSFQPAPKPVVAIFQPAILLNDLTRIVCNLIELTPEQSEIFFSIEKFEPQKCRIAILNNGINLTRNLEVTKACKLPVTIASTAKNNTRYSLEVELFEEHAAPGLVQWKNGQHQIPNYYNEIRKRLRSHFMKTDSLIDALLRKNPREAIFLKRVNDLILSNLENRQFDANHLSGIMNMSRTQLFRRLKPIILQSPGNYIRTMRLQRAKELLETTDMRINEVAFKIGFETASHFTKVFTKRFGVNPSVAYRRKPIETNEPLNATSELHLTHEVRIPLVHHSARVGGEKKRQRLTAML